MRKISKLSFVSLVGLVVWLASGGVSAQPLCAPGPDAFQGVGQRGPGNQGPLAFQNLPPWQKQRLIQIGQRGRGQFGRGGQGFAQQRGPAAFNRAGQGRQQMGQRGRGQFGRGGQGFAQQRGPANREQIQRRLAKHLDLTDDQIEKIRKIDESKRSTLEKAEKTAKKKFMKVLTGTQREKLEQIQGRLSGDERARGRQKAAARQRTFGGQRGRGQIDRGNAGPTPQRMQSERRGSQRGFAEHRGAPDLGRQQMEKRLGQALDLTPEQVEKARKIRETQRDRMRAVIEDGDREFKSLLTKEQTAKFEKMRDNKQKSREKGKADPKTKGKKDPKKDSKKSCKDK